jgi:hypothetical protein
MTLVCLWPLHASHRGKILSPLKSRDVYLACT